MALPRSNRTPTGVNDADSGSRFEYPSDQEEWVARYEWLIGAYHGDPYTLSDIKGLHLFRALDENGKVLALTDRLTRDVQHVVDTDAAALASHELLLEQADGGSGANLGEAQAALKRSGLGREKGRWARMFAGTGDFHLEVIRTQPQRPYECKLVWWDPRLVEPVYKVDDPTVLDHAIIRSVFFDEADARPDRFGVRPTAQPLHTYVRILYPDRVEVYLDGEPVEEEGGPHSLGVVPLVHESFLPFAEPEHGLWAAVGLDKPLAAVDSLFTQIRAIGNRHANPILALKGAKLGADSDVLKLGRILSGLPKDGDAYYLEAALAGCTALLDAAQRQREAVRETLPEFLFTESGGAESGRARSYRAAAFANKIREVRGRWYSAIAKGAEMCLAMEQDTELDLSTDAFKLTGGPILPPDLLSELEAISVAKRDGVIKRVDYVKHLQRLGIVPPDVDPEDYAAEAQDEQASRAAQFFDPGDGDDLDDEDDDNDDG